MNLTYLILISFILILYISLFIALMLILRSKLLGLVIKTVLAVILLAIIISPVLIIFMLSKTPAAVPINDTVNIIDGSQQFSITSIAMPAPTYLSGEGVIEKFYTSIVTIHAANNSEKQIYLGLQSYSSSGSIGFYSPGSCYSSKVIAIDPNWTGDVQFPIKHPRFVNGGCINLTLLKCEELHTDIFYNLPGTVLFEKKYIMVPEE